MLKSLIHGAAQRFGYHVIPTWRLRNLALRNHLAALFELYGVTCVLDVGANRGQFGEFLRWQVGYTGRILSFEPVRGSYRILDEKAGKDENWRAYDFALGHENRELPIHVMQQDMFSSFLTPDHDSSDQFKDLNTINRRELVQLRTLDGVIEDLRAENGFGSFYLKMDTQGYDMNVLRGAERSLVDVIALQTEVPVRRIYREMPCYEEVVERLGALGFDVSGMFCVTRDEHLRVVELDCVAVNRAFLST